MSPEIHNLFGLMMRARKIDVGSAKIIEGIKKKKYPLVVLAEDASDLTVEQFEKQAVKTKTEIIRCGRKDSLADAIGKATTVAIGIVDRGFAKKIQQLLQDKNND